MGISVSDGLLSLDLDTGEFPPEELEDLYRSLLRKQRYHRLRDGRFLKLDGSPYETPPGGDGPYDPLVPLGSWLRAM